MKKIFKMALTLVFGSVISVAQAAEPQIDCQTQGADCQWLLNVKLDNVFLDASNAFGSGSGVVVQIGSESATGVTDSSRVGEDAGVCEVWGLNNGWKLYMPYDTDARKAMYSTLVAAQVTSQPVVLIFSYNTASQQCEVGSVAMGSF